MDQVPPSAATSPPGRERPTHHRRTLSHRPRSGKTEESRISFAVAVWFSAKAWYLFFSDSPDLSTRPTLPSRTVPHQEPHQEPHHAFRLRARPDLPGVH